MLRQTITPTFSLDPGYLLTFVAMVGTTITPWGQFFVQAYVVDKGITAAEYSLHPHRRALRGVPHRLHRGVHHHRHGGTLYVNGIRIDDAADAALALQPLAGRLPARCSPSGC